MVQEENFLNRAGKKDVRTMNIIKINEYDIDTEKNGEIQRLLLECFPGYPENRIYFKQVPHFRFLAMDEQDRIIGQMGLDYRVMNLDGKPVRVLGVIDLCVIKEFRSQGVASRLLRRVDEFCLTRNIDFILLFADESAVYKRNGFKSASNNCKWYKIDDRNLTSFEVGEEKIAELMVKETGSLSWKEGKLDLLGHLY